MGGDIGQRAHDTFQRLSTKQTTSSFLSSIFCAIGVTSALVRCVTNLSFPKQVIARAGIFLGHAALRSTGQNRLFSAELVCHFRTGKINQCGSFNNLGFFLSPLQNYTAVLVQR